MFANVFPLTASLLSKGLGHREAKKFLSKVEEINPEEFGPSQGIDLSDQDRAKITSTLPGGNLSIQMSRVDRNNLRHQATVRYEVKNVLATPNGIYSVRDVVRRGGPASKIRIPLQRVPKYERGFYSLTNAGITHFAHWLLDGLTTSYLKHPNENLFLPVRPDWAHAQAYATLLEIDRIKFPFAYFETLSFADDVGMNRNKIFRLERLKSELRDRLPPGTIKRVYLRRGSTGEARELANEDELWGVLRKYGFIMVDVTAPLGELHAALQNAEVCVSMEGSHMMHALLAAPREALYLVINPADRFVTAVAVYLPGVGGRMAAVVADRDGDKYWVDPSSVVGALSRNGISL